MRYITQLVFLISVLLSPLAYAVAPADTRWVLISSNNNESEFWDVTHVKYSIVPNTDDILLYLNIKSEYTYYNRSFEDKPSMSVGTTTQLYDSIIYEICRKYKNGKTSASGVFAENLGDGKTLCSLKKNERYYIIVYQGSLLLQNKHLSPISPPVADVTLSLYVKDIPVISFISKGEPASAKPIDIYGPSLVKPYMAPRYNKMAETINTYILPQINNNNPKFYVGNLDLIPPRES